MQDHDTANEVPKKWARIPAAVRLKLSHAIDRHLRQHGARNYDLLREEAEFRAYIGKHLGEAGDKRLDRLIREVRASLPKATRRRDRDGDGVGLGGQDDVGEPSQPSSVPIAVASTRPFAPALSLIGFEQLQSLIGKRIPQLERAIADTFNERGELVSADLFVKLSKELRATVAMVADLAARFQAQVSTERFLEGLAELLDQEFAPEPERYARVFDRINRLIAECGGLPATTGGTR